MVNGSLPSRERGLKCKRESNWYDCGCVAPLAGAWIEIAWSWAKRSSAGSSLPSRERGLKSDAEYSTIHVASGRSPRGSVD